MKKRHSLFVCAAILFGCLQPALAGTTTQTLTHDGKERSFLLTVPGNAAKDKAMPLVMALHFYPADGRDMALLSGLSELAEREGFIVAFPNGINGGFNAMICCGNEDDVGFVNAVIEKVAADHAVDRARIYATGMSNGADLSYRLAAKLPGVFAAIAPVSGGMSGDWMAMKTGNLPEKPVSLITFYGKRDRYQGVYMAGSRFWAEKLRCEQKTSTIDGTNIEFTEASCADGSTANTYVLPDMGHSWPGGPQASRLGYPASPINATELIWKFFQAHRRN